MNFVVTFCGMVVIAVVKRNIFCEMIFLKICQPVGAFAPDDMHSLYEFGPPRRENVYFCPFRLSSH